MTADDIKALVEQLRKHSETGTSFEGTMQLARNAANALDGLTQDIEDLKHDLDRHMSIVSSEIDRAELAEAQVSAAYTALDAVADWAQHEDANSETGSGTRLLALLLKHGVHPREAKS